MINTNSSPLVECTEYSPDLDLSKYSVGITSHGLYMVKLEIMLWDNGCLDSVPNHCSAPVDREGNDLAFEKSKSRYEEIKSSWKTLEDKVKAYNQAHGFNKIDFEKKEFD